MIVERDRKLGLDIRDGVARLERKKGDSEKNQETKTDMRDSIQYVLLSCGETSLFVL